MEGSSLEIQTDPDALVRTLSGVLLMAMGIWVATLRPRQGTGLAFAGFAGCYGVLYVLRNIVDVDDATRTPIWFLEVLFLAGAMLALTYLGASFPNRLRDGRVLGWALAITIPCWIAAEVAAFQMFGVGVIVEDPTWAAWGRFLVWPIISLIMEGVVIPTVLLTQALRFRSVQGEAAPSLRRRIALLSAALCLYPPIEVADNLPAGTVFGTMGWLFDAARVIPYLAVAGLWLYNSNLADAPARRAARLIAWILLGTLLIGLLSKLDGDDRGPEKGIARILMVLLLGYAILRHQLLGFDIKLRWTIRQGTIVAAFVAVFFTASELAQAFLSDKLGPYLGITAVGLLVFALAPLQRVAERLASAAVPDVASMQEAERIQLYREQALAAWADGRLSAKEREILEVARRRLRIEVQQAHEIELDVSRRRAVA
jgi:hypothetical protein